MQFSIMDGTKNTQTNFQSTIFTSKKIKAAINNLDNCDNAIEQNKSIIFLQELFKHSPNHYIVVHKLIDKELENAFSYSDTSNLLELLSLVKCLIRNSNVNVCNFCPYNKIVSYITKLMTTSDDQDILKNCEMCFQLIYDYCEYREIFNILLIEMLEVENEKVFKLLGECFINALANFGMHSFYEKDFSDLYELLCKLYFEKLNFRSLSSNLFQKYIIILDKYWEKSINCLNEQLKLKVLKIIDELKNNH